MSQLYGRKATLIVSSASKQLDLSAAKFFFQTRNADVNVPNTLSVTIINLSEDTAASIKKEYTKVTLMAGYHDGPFGVLFDGTIKQVLNGRLNPTDTYCEIQAADADLAHNFAVINKTLAKGSKLSDRVQAITDAMNKVGNTKKGYVFPDLDKLGGVLPRGKVLFGMARDYADDLANTSASSWSIQGNTFQLIPLTGYAPGDAIVLTSRTGMIGLPEQSDQGIKIRSLLLPTIKIGCQVQINNKSIQQAQIDLSFTAINLLAFVAADGFYRVFVAEHSGDTRDTDWYTDMTCLSIDASAKPTSSVNAYGGT